MKDLYESDNLDLNFFTHFIKEIKITIKAAGIHCMTVHYEKLFPELTT